MSPELRQRFWECKRKEFLKILERQAVTVIPPSESPKIRKERGHRVLGSRFVHTAEDHGGVHLNSGIPNHAFYLAAQAMGGNAWDRPARIWYDAFTSALNKRATFLQAAGATTASAQRMFGEDAAKAVADAWRAVGLDPEEQP